LIIAALRGTLSDPEISVIAIDVLAANSSNQLGCSELCKLDTRPFNQGSMIWSKGAAQISYFWVGRLKNGLHVVRSWSNHGGSRTFGGIMILRAT
jgi:hypothetical protein